MSYSLTTNCPACKLKTDCLDAAFVQAAISGIHSVNYANGKQTTPHHLGSGSIEIHCNNFINDRPSPSELKEE